MAHDTPSGRGTPRHPTAFILGAPRSGTSLVYKALCLHPEAAWLSNWVRRAPAVPELAFLNRIARRFPKTRDAVWFTDDANAYVYGAQRSLADRLFPQPVEGEPVFTHAGIAALPGPTPQDALSGARLSRSLGLVADWSGAKVLVSKRIANNVRVPLLADSFPDGRFVNLVRDGRAVAYSLSRVDWWEDGPLWWYGGTPRYWKASGRDPWEACARHWVEEVGILDSGLASIPADRRLDLAYEELVRDPVPTLERVAAFVGLPEDPEWVARIDRLGYPDKNEAWSGALDAATIARIEQVQREPLLQHGYIA